jgi:hypothetical protein
MLQIPYKSASKIESIGRYSIGIDIQVALNREITEEEHNLCGNFISKLAALIRRTNLLLDPEVIANIAKERIDLLACFPDNNIFVIELENGYSSEMVNPWFFVTTKVGHFKIGWRKRVISIDWTATNIDISAEKLFPDEDVTKDGKLIHAYGYEKAKEYLNKLING